MKKIRSFACIVISLLLVWGCGKSEDPKKLQAGTYRMEWEDAEFLFIPWVELKENGQCMFTATMLSSFLYVGTYEIQDDELILSGEDGSWEYRFLIQDDHTFMFEEENSSKVITYKGDVPVEDGAEFVLEE